MDRLGAVADIQFVIEFQNYQKENILIIAGDTLFYPDFSLQNFIQKFQDLQESSSGRNLIVHCHCPGRLTMHSAKNYWRGKGQRKILMVEGVHIDGKKSLHFFVVLTSVLKVNFFGQNQQNYVIFSLQLAPLKI